MNFQINPKIIEKYPDLKVGLILIKDVDNTRRISALESLARGVQAQKANEFKTKDFDFDPRIKAWTKAFSDMNINAKKIQPNIRKLIQDSVEGKFINHSNTLLDIAYHFSIKNISSLIAIDLDWICGDLKLTYTQGGEPFRESDSIEVENAEESEVAYLDDGGVVSRYWNNDQSKRTKVTSQTKNAAFFVENLTNLSIEEFTKQLNEIAQTINKYIGADIKINILFEENLSADLEIKGLENVDDSKVSAQEKAYFHAKQERSNFNIQNIIQKSATKTLKPKLEKSPKQEKDTTKIEMIDKESFKEKIKAIIEQSLVKAFKNPTSQIVDIDYPKLKEHGDYSTPVALKLAKEFGKSPMDIANIIKENISKEEFIEKVEVLNPGFINFYISKFSLLGELKEVTETKDFYGLTNVGEGKTILAEYSSPNIAKPLGIHHILSTVIGQSVYNIYKFLGFNTISINHIGDWGTQFGKLISAYKKWGAEQVIEKDPINELLKLYVKFHEESEKDESLNDEAREEFRKLEQGDVENRTLLKWITDLSMLDINRVYDKLGNITFDYTQGESFYEEQLEEILLEGKQRAIFEQGEKGSFVVQYDDENISPFVVQKSDGATLYSTRDFAALKYRIQNWHPLKILYFVDVAQNLHFKQLFQAAERFTWYHGEGVHVNFGRMSFKDGSFSTRKGNVIKLEEVLDEAISRSKVIIEEKGKVNNIEEVSKVIGVGAVKYNILSQNRSSDITFDWDNVLSLDGNSSPYLQYTYARAKSILRKAQEQGDYLVIDENVDFKQSEEENQLAEKAVSILRIIPKFKESILLAGQEYKPNLISNYIYELAQAFNAFYNEVRVLDETNPIKKHIYLNLSFASSQIIKNGLKLLGIDVLEEM